MQSILHVEVVGSDDNNRIQGLIYLTPLSNTKKWASPFLPMT